MHPHAGLITLLITPQNLAVNGVTHYFSDLVQYLVAYVTAVTEHLLNIFGAMSVEYFDDAAVSYSSFPRSNAEGNGNLEQVAQKEISNHKTTFI